MPANFTRRAALLGIGAGVLICTAGGFWHVWAAPEIEPVGMTTAPAREYITPEFRRTYTFVLQSGFTVIFTAHNDCCGDRYWSAEIDQADAKWVLLDPSKPPDHLVDKAVLQAMPAEFDQAQAADKFWMSTTGNQEFVDQDGTKWKRE